MALSFIERLTSDMSERTPTSLSSFKRMICVVATLVVFVSAVGPRGAASATNKAENADTLDANGNNVSKLVEASTRYFHITGSPRNYRLVLSLS